MTTSMRDPFLQCPMQGDWPKKPVVSSYDAVEKGGFVWLFYGNRGVPEDVRPPIPMMPEVRRAQLFYR